MKRIIDVILALIIGTISIPLIIVLSLFVKLNSEGPVLYWSERVGLGNSIFRMPKFRTMRTDTPVVATHLLGNADEYLAKGGGFMRKTSLDELPQLWSILKGDMSFVGPRPALHNQYDLIDLRTKAGIHNLVPGLTGWAQINGRDDLLIPAKVNLDIYYLENISISLDIKILLYTAVKAFRCDGVSH